jgi:hypothetical protein
VSNSLSLPLSLLSLIDQSGEETSCGLVLHHDITDTVYAAPTVRENPRDLTDATPRFSARTEWSIAIIGITTTAKTKRKGKAKERLAQILQNEQGPAEFSAASDLEIPRLSTGRCNKF